MFIVLFLASLIAAAFLFRRLSQTRKRTAGERTPVGESADGATNGLLALSKTLEQHGRGQTPATAWIKKQTPVRLRWLPDGQWTDAQAMESQGRWLRVNVAAGADPAEWPLGAALEIDSGATLYLGEVQSREDRTLVVTLEQMMDTQKLAELNRAWNELDQRRPREA